MGKIYHIDDTCLQLLSDFLDEDDIMVFSSICKKVYRRLKNLTGIELRITKFKLKNANNVLEKLKVDPFYLKEKSPDELDITFEKKMQSIKFLQHYNLSHGLYTQAILLNNSNIFQEAVKLTPGLAPIAKQLSLKKDIEDSKEANKIVSSINSIRTVLSLEA